MSDGEGITSVSLHALKLVCSLYGSYPPYKVMECNDTPLASLQVESDSSSERGSHLGSLCLKVAKATCACRQLSRGVLNKFLTHLNKHFFGA